MISDGGRAAAFAAAAICLCLAGAGCGKVREFQGVTVFRNGVGPDGTYAGCTDTWISDNRYEQKRDYSRQPTMRCGDKRNVLIRFDLSALPKDDVVHKAVLRLAEVSYPKKPRGQQDWPTSFSAYRIVRSWSPNANWVEHTAGKTRNEAGQPWESPGGDLDPKTDFGQGKPGLVAMDALIDGPSGHVHELEITALVRLWQSGESPNYGLALVAAEKANATLASSKWHVPSYRPELIVSHGPKGVPAAAIEPLKRAPTKIELDALAATPDAGQAEGEYVTVRVGRNANCTLRGASSDTYLKEAVERFPGAWGWMNMSRVGGLAGDFSRSLLYFDLSGIPKTASVKKARLVLTLTPYTNREVTGYRYGAFLIQPPARGEAPGWKAEQVTAAERQAGAAWPEGGVVACSTERPVAVGTVGMKEVTVRDRKQKVPGTMEFDLTGAVRAWLTGWAPNCGVVLDNRIEGGAYDFYASRSYEPAHRPYLEIELSPAVPGEAVAAPAFPAEEEPMPKGDYWIEPMRKAHARFRGKPGTLAQYGDSITITNAYLAGFSHGKEVSAKNCTAEVAAELAAITRYADRTLWNRWKGPEWGNNGQMKSDWFLDNIDAWQKKMDPEVGVILFGTNDIGGICPPEYTENMAAAIRRMLADGTVPLLTTVPPKSGRDAYMRDYYLALACIARQFGVPVIDYYAEIMRRRPEDWDGRLEKFKERKGYQVLTLISGDGVHPSNPQEYVGDFSEEALDNNGFGLRNYMTFRTYYRVIAKVFQARPE